MRRGWSGVKTNPSGTGITYDEPSQAQRQAFGLAMFQCTAMYLPDPRLLAEQTPELAGQQWDYIMGYLMPCLAAHGYPNLEPPPTREVFVAENTAWAGYPPLPDNESGQQVARECPQNVPSSILLG